MKKFFWNLMTIVMVGLMSAALNSCGKDDEPVSPTLSVDETSVSFNSNGGTTSIGVQSNTSWSVSGGDNWLSVSKSTNSITLTTQKNESTEEKSTSITVRTDDGSLSQAIRVTVAGAEQILELSGLDAPFSSQAGSLQTAQELTIKCNTKWEISTNASWVIVDSRNGSGDKVVKVWMESENNTTEVRNATLTVTTGSKSESKRISQEAGIDGNLYIKPNETVILSNGFACDWSYGNNVMFYYSRIFESSEIDRKTDAEIIALMSSNTADRDTPGDDWITSWNLYPQTTYILCTVGYDKNGNNGALTRYEITTKSGVNQAFVAISDVWYDDTTWNWSTTMNGFVTRYYQWFITLSGLHSSTDAAVAWFFQREMKQNPDDFPPIVNSTSWGRSRNNGTIFDLATWAIDANGNFSGLIDRFVGQVNSSGSKSINKTTGSDTDILKRYKTKK